VVQRCRGSADGQRQCRRGGGADVQRFRGSAQLIVDCAVDCAECREVLQRYSGREGRWWCRGAGCRAVAEVLRCSVQWCRYGDLEVLRCKGAQRWRCFGAEEVQHR